MSGRHRTTLLAAALLVAGMLSGCSSDDSDSPADPATTEDGAQETSVSEPDETTDEQAQGDAGDDDAAAVAGGPLPDPCSLVSTDDLAALLGTQPSEPRLDAPVPDQRATCFYSDGTIIGVSAGDIVETNRASVEEGDGVTAESVEDVDDLGTNAWVATYGGVVQVYATNGTVTLDLTSVTETDDAITTAQALLDAL